MTIVSLPLRSNSWLSASTINRACSATATGTAGALGGAGGVGTDGTVDSAAGAACKLTPQLEQKASPAGLVAPHDAQTTVAAGAAAAGAAAGTDAGALAGA